MAKHQTFSVGDAVHFKQGRKVDWTVVSTMRAERLGQPQRLLLRSGMSGRVMSTTADNVIPRPDPRQQ